MPVKVIWADVVERTVRCKVAMLVHVPLANRLLKVHKNDNFFGFDFAFCTFSLLVMHK